MFRPLAQAAHERHGDRSLTACLKKLNIKLWHLYKMHPCQAGYKKHTLRSSSLCDLETHKY